MQINLNQSEIEGIIYCIQEKLEILNKDQFSTQFQFELEELYDKFNGILKEVRGY